MCYNLEYLSIGPGRVIIKEGQVGENFYIIMSGIDSLLYIRTSGSFSKARRENYTPSGKMSDLTCRTS
jgi:hypothetical protein